MTTEILDSTQCERAVEVMREYLNAPAGPDGKTALEKQTKLDQDRRQLIDHQLKPLVDSYLAGRLALSDFKTQIDGLNKRNEYWGFKGIKGQMFFNMVVNTAADLGECDQELKAAIVMPTNDDIAKSRIRTFSSYVKRLGDEHVERGGAGHGRPKLGSIPFFLSYFWQIQGRDTWPVYYTNTVQVLEDLNLWRPSDDLAMNYTTYKQLHDELVRVFTQEGKRRFGLYEVEHVFWFKGGNPYGDAKPLVVEAETTATERRRATDAVDGRLPDSYVPPIVAILPQMASNDPDLVEAAKASGTSLERAFEKSINAAFTILGFQTQLLGQGQGRVPDGLAINVDNSYGILWDGKVRGEGYAIGTDDRTIREYITTQSRDLKRKRGLRNIYYVIVSSRFSEDFDEVVRGVKMDTDISELCLLEADALVAMVDLKLRDPHQVTLGPDGIQRLFCSSGILTATTVRDDLT